MGIEAVHVRKLKKQHLPKSDFNSLLILMELAFQKERQMCKQTITLQCDIHSDRSIV